MQNKKIKNLFSSCFIIGFISFLYFIHIIENTEKPIKTTGYKKQEGFKENRYGLYLSSFYANFNGDYNKLSTSYDEAVKQNNDDFLGKLFVLNSTNNNKEEILKQAREEYKKDPENIIPIIYLSHNHFINKQYKKSYDLLSSVKGKSDTFIMKLLRSWVLIAQNKNDDALDLLETEFDNKVFRKYILMHLAAQSELSNEIEYAQELYEEVLSNENPNIFDIENIISFYIRQGNKKQAIKIVGDFYKKTPDSISAFVLYENIKNNTYKPVYIDTVNKGMAKAIFDISSILNVVFSSSQDLFLMYNSMISDLYPSFYMSNLLKSETYKNLKNETEFLKLSDTIPQSHYLYITSQLNKASYFLLNNKKEQGVSIINKLIEQFPRYAHLYIKLAHFYQDSKDFESAIKNYEKALELTKNENLRATIYFDLAQIYDIEKNTIKAHENLEKSLKLKNKNPLFLNYYGYFLVINNIDIDKGLLLIGQALSKDSINPYFLDSYGWALFKKGELEKSLTMLEFAKGLQPKNPVIIDHLADVYWSLGRKREAIYEWKKALTFKDINMGTEQLNFNKIEYKINYGL